MSTAIQWSDETWNPTVGCMKVSAGCDHCYAIRTAFRLDAMGQAPYEGLTYKRADGSMNWTGKVRTLPERLALPLKWKTPRRIFVDSMSDLFHPDVPYEFIAAVFGVMAATPHHTYQILTKRPERMQAFMHDELDRVWGGVRNGSAWCAFQAFLRVRQATGREDPDLHAAFDSQTSTWPLPNVWLGTSVEDQRAADERIPLLLKTPAAVRFLSCEPLLGPLRLFGDRGYYDSAKGRGEPGSPGIHWVIAGGESGPGARPLNVDWIRGLVLQCAFAGVPMFTKQLGGRPVNSAGRPIKLVDHKGGNVDEWPEDLRVRQFPTPVHELAHV